MGEVWGLYPYHAFYEGIGSQIAVLFTIYV